MAQESRKSELIAQLARARSEVSTNFRGLSRDVNFVQRIEGSIQRHRMIWLGGASLLGFVAARLPARAKRIPADRGERKVKAEKKAIEAGFLVTVLKIAFDLARPLLTKWATRKVAAYAEERFGSDSPH